MAFEILKYDTASPTSDRKKTQARAKVLTRLADQFSDQIHHNKLTAIAESQKAAQADSLQGAIDPNRRENDEAYAASVLRNELFTTSTGLATNLDNAASEHSNMNPEDYHKMLQDKSTEFYKANAESPFAETNAEVFATFTAKNQAGLIAKQAKVYKDNMKVKQGMAAITALSQLPPGEGEAFELNTATLIDKMLPGDRYTQKERINAVVAAARGAAANGDRRLLDYAENLMDSDLHAAQATQGAENQFSKWETEAQAKEIAEGYTEREKASMNGTYDYARWEQESSDPEMVKRYGHATINRWFKDAHTNHINTLTKDDGIEKFKAGVSMAGIPDKVQQEVFKHVQGEMNQHPPGSDEQVQAMSEFAGLLSKQDTVNKDMKAQFGAHMNRLTLTKEQWADPKFQQTAVMFRALKQTMSPDQLIRQVGKDAYMRGLLIEDFMTQAGGDAEKAGDMYIANQIIAKDQPKLSTPKLDARDNAEMVADIIAGDVEGLDPAANRWHGMSSKTDDAVNTGRLSYELNRHYGEAISQNLGPEAAKEYALKMTAAGVQYFGNEFVWTEGVSMNTMLNMPPGASADHREEAFEAYAESMGLDPSTTHFKMVGQYGWLTDQHGVPLEELGLFPRNAIGELWRSTQADIAENEQARNTEDRAYKMEVRNRNFENELNEQFGQFNDKAAFLADGTTLGMFRYAGEEDRVVYRERYRTERRTMLGKYFQKGWSYIRDVMDGKYEGTEVDRYKTVANQDFMMYGKDPMTGEAKPTTEGGHMPFEETATSTVEAKATPTAIDHLPNIGSVAPRLAKQTTEVKKKVVETAESIGVEPAVLTAMIQAESSWKPTAENGKGAAGLMQWTAVGIEDLNETYPDLNLTRAKILKMKPEEQLDLTQKWFKMWKGRGHKIDNIQDAYMTIFYPKAIGKGPDFVIAKKGQKAYDRNPGLDASKDGTLTAGEAAHKVQSKYDQLKGK